MTKTWHRPTLWSAVVMAVGAAGCAVALLVDGRVLRGESVWAKPFEFAVSPAVYSATLSWLVSLPHKGRRWTSGLATVIAAMFLANIVLALVLSFQRFGRPGALPRGPGHVHRLPGGRPVRQAGHGGGRGRTAGRVGRRARPPWGIVERVRTRLVVVAALGYLGLPALLTWQALRGECLVHPGGATAAALGGPAVVVAAGAAWAVRGGAAVPPPVRQPVPQR
ncbi:hypothetical protein ACRAKI_29445 [Saccharothrix isguenensis]